MLADFSAKWFALYYPVLGLIILVTGLGVMIKRNACFRYLSSHAEHEQPPAFIKNALKYFLLFTLPCLVLSFVPFSWPELLFSLWSLVMVYIAGIQLVRWPQRRRSIKKSP